MVWVTGKKLQGGKYTIERQLRRGRFGITYLVKNQNSDRLVIKTLDGTSLTFLSQPEQERLETMFWQEAIKLTRCQHPHIVRFTEPFKEAESLCLVMEYIDGVNLDERSQLQIPEELALVYIRQIGEALTVVHENKLIHGDVRPENIILRGGKSEAVLIDFDLAIDFDNPLTTRRAKENANGFSPPELYTTSIKPTPASDIYSLAATLYVLLTGIIPVDAIIRKLDNIHLPEPKEINPQISDRVNKAILAGMKLNSQERPQSVKQWIDSLGTTTNTTKQKPSWNWDKKMQFWGVVIAAIAAFATLLQSMGALMPILTNSPTQKPNPISTNKP
ncbi:serine/threonine-protein kinase [Anabaena sp. UHCC 0451]|uniref:serine/threonine protein kinase n=1 Tax=Anabaena sp. UHCC 0451 TaxID=2055235 RepID=UPI002B1FF54E|nr:serine/threonine-protein kinase [Anabaena sp. UHCC 0451]MEA5579120.1 serine/threonine-protein kinase [Anabaena sp. UHCC 0451]